MPGENTDREAPIEVIRSDAVARLRGEVIALLNGVYEYVDERVYHKHSKEYKRRQQIKPGFFVVLFHYLYLKINTFFAVLAEDEYLMRL